ncbi:MAG TPA: hypothetical protein VMT79_00380 [Candidatus Binatia bacterium]|nr:hypothetical protein [Candidatus Binatia bacterium]
MFCNEAGGALNGDNLRHRAFHRVLAQAGLRKIRFHDLRHTYACWYRPNVNARISRT